MFLAAGSYFSSHRLFIIALLGIAVVALSVRLYGLTTIGVGGNDTILYYTLAEHWLKGDFVFKIGDSIQVFRPVLLAFNALALKVFGHSDYAIKLANTLLDVINLLLLSLLAWLISRRYAVVLASAVTYAFLPIAIWSARQELPHTSSAFFILSAYLFIWLATSGKFRLAYTFLAGLCVGAAALTHEELIFLAAPLALFLLFAPRFQGGADTLASGCRRLAVFSAAPVVAIAIVMYLESAVVQSVISGSISSASNSERFYPEVFGRFLWDGIVGSTSAALAISLMLCMGYFCWQLKPGLRKSDLPFTLWVGFCVLTPIGFVALYAVFFNALFPRGFLPLTPLLIVAVYYCVARITEGGSNFFSGITIAVLVVLIALSNLASFSAFNVANRRFSSAWAEPVWPTSAGLKQGYGEFIVDAKYVPSYATHWRAIFYAFDGKVDVHHKLLLMPSTIIYAPGRRALQTDVYFGDNAVYRLDHTQQTLDEIVRDSEIKWIVLTLGQLRTAPPRLGRYLYNGEWAESGPLDLAHAYGMDSYSEKAEFKALLRYLRVVGATEVFPYPRGSFEARVSRAWLLP